MCIERISLVLRVNGPFEQYFPFLAFMFAEDTKSLLVPTRLLSGHMGNSTSLFTFYSLRNKKASKAKLKQTLSLGMNKQNCKAFTDVSLVFRIVFFVKWEQVCNSTTLKSHTELGNNLPLFPPLFISQRNELLKLLDRVANPGFWGRALTLGEGVAGIKFNYCPRKLHEMEKNLAAKGARAGGA